MDSKQHIVDSIAMTASLGPVTVHKWEQNFGVITPASQWGDKFWDGMSSMALRQGGPNGRPALFTAPLNFSKQNAKKPQHPVLNPPSSNVYPAFVWMSIISPGEWWIKMRCVHILWFGSKAWVVHPSWLQIATEPLPEQPTTDNQDVVDALACGMGNVDINSDVTTTVGNHDNSSGCCCG